MRREGPLEELIQIEEQTAMTFSGAKPELLAKVRELIEADSGATIVEEGHPKTTLERLFVSLSHASNTDEKGDEK